MLGENINGGNTFLSLLGYNFKYKEKFKKGRLC